VRRPVRAAPYESDCLTQFSDLGLAEALLRAVSAEGYTTPTPIQTKVIPAMLAGRDLVGIAQTGTGKTAAFVLPLLNEISRNPVAPGPRGCGTLILAPTRELASQIAASIRTYGRFTRHSVAVVIGGARPGPQVKAMAQGVDILVATPGRLLDHMATRAIRLDATRTVILDEADQMLDLGFMPAIRRIMPKLAPERQTVLLSATMPKQIRDLAADFLSDPVEIAVTPASRPIDRIEQRVMHVDGPAKRGVLVDILGGAGVERAIVFTRTKRGADKVKQHLEGAGLAASAIHGNKSQGQRERTLSDFRSGRVTILVATDIAARGIDVDDVSHVVNFELPNVPEAYVHRIGRTARAGKSGFAVSLCDPAERGLLRDIEKLIGRRIETSGAPVKAAAQPSAPSPAAPAPAPRPVPASEGRKRPPQARNGRGKVRTSAEAAPRKENRPDGGASAAGLTRMLGNIGDKREDGSRSGRGRGRRSQRRVAAN